MTLIAVAVTAFLGGAGVPASAQPVYKDQERFGPPADARLAPPHLAGPPVLPYVEPDPTRPARRLTGGPGYVGSDFGLGKPSFTGLGSRPDWGRSGN